MKFLRKRQTYDIMYKKEDAIENLRMDSRVSRIVSGGRFKLFKHILIYTNPIIPSSQNEHRENKYILHPIGRYRIKLIDMGGMLDCSIKRIPKGIGTRNKWYHYHIGPDGDNICWGHAAEEIYTIKNNKDWYWLGKYCLSLLEDGDLETGGIFDDSFIGRWYFVTLTLQKDFLMNTKPYGYKKKISILDNFLQETGGKYYNHQ